MDLDAARRQRHRDPPGADAELERPPVAGEPGQEVDRRPDDGSVEHPVVGLVVLGSHGFAEGAILVVHRRNLAVLARMASLSDDRPTASACRAT